MAKQKHKRRIAALKSKKKPGESWAHTVQRYRFQHQDWPMIATLELIEREPKKSLLDGWLCWLRLRTWETDMKAFDRLNDVFSKSKRSKPEPGGGFWGGSPPPHEEWLALRERLYGLIVLLKNFERAVMSRDDKWFEAQARAIRGVGFHQTHGAYRQRFESAVLNAVMRAWEEGEKGTTIPDIFDRLEKHEEGTHLIVEGCRFASARRCKADIKRLMDREGWKLP